jgi:Tol biopolymer transport system component/DNA-binding winged helix-turn-helix (wHTH) protein
VLSDAPQPSDAPDAFVVQADEQTWRVQPGLHRVTPEEGAPTQLEPRVMQVLLVLARRAGEVVSREELLDEVWAETVVNEEALTRAVFELRRAFDDSAKTPAVIETIRGTGYRFVASVEPASPAEATDSPPPEADEPSSGGGSWYVRPTFIGAAVGALAVAVAAAVGALSLGQDASSPTLLETTPFTSFPGREIMPAFSPNGSRVAFSWTGDTEGNFDIYLKQENTADPLRLTDHPARDGFPAWSPDGTTIAFARSTDSTHALYTVPALGGTPRRLIETRAAAHGLDWSPDGESLLYADRRTPDGPYRLVRLSLSSRDTTLLTDPPFSSIGDRYPRWSPDGRSIAFSRGGGSVDGHNLYRMDADGSDVQPLTETEISIRGLDWTPDGRHVVFSSYRSGTYSLRKVNVDDETGSWVPVTGEQLSSPSVADRTGALVYEKMTFEMDVWALDLAADSTAPGGGPPSRPLLTSTRRDFEVRYSPDGDRLVFTSSRSGALELWLSDADGSHPTKLTDFGGAFLGTPRWHPNGERVAFFANVDGQADVYVMDVPGGVPEQVRIPEGDGASNDWVAGWSRDGQWLYFASDRSGSWQLWKVRPDGTGLTQVTESGGLAAAESVDGDTLFYSKRGTPGLWMRPTDGGPERKVLDDLASDDWGNWAVTGEGLYFIRRTEGGPRVAYREFGSGETRTVTALPSITGPSLAVSPDGERLLYARIEGANSDLITTTLTE